MQNEINKYLDLPIKTYDEFKALLNKKILYGLNNTTFTLQSLIGKDRRRINNNDYVSYIQQYESEIQNGQITIIEDVTAQISATSDENNTVSQKIYRKKV